MTIAEFDERFCEEPGFATQNCPGSQKTRLTENSTRTIQTNICLFVLF